LLVLMSIAMLYCILKLPVYSIDWLLIPPWDPNRVKIWSCYSSAGEQPTKQGVLSFPMQCKIVMSHFENFYML
jgi:hypothetical protein